MIGAIVMFGVAIYSAYWLFRTLTRPSEALDFYYWHSDYNPLFVRMGFGRKPGDERFVLLVVRVFVGAFTVVSLFVASLAFVSSLQR